MSFNTLQSFLNALDGKKDLLRVKSEVDPILEITEIATRVVRREGPAILFERVKGSSFPVLINVLGAERRVKWALGNRSPQEVGESLARFAESLMPPRPTHLWSQRGMIARLLKMRPAPLRRAPVFQNRIEPVSLNRLPIAQSWPKDGGRFITFPLVVTKSMIDGKQNMGVYRMHVYDRTRTGMHWQIAKGGGYHYQEAEQHNQALPVAAVLGGDPILMMCGVLPLPEGIDEMAFAGFLRGASTRTAKTRDQLRIPAEADFILEGYVPPLERQTEGPYGDHFGHYSLAAPFPVFHIERIWHKRDAIFPVAVVGKPPQEDQVIGDAVQEMLLPLLKIMHKEVADLWAYQEAGFHNLLVASVKQRFEKEALKTGLWCLGEGQLALTKCVILVDPDVNVRRFPEVLKAIRANFHPREDFTLLPVTSQDTLDFTSFKMNLGSKMILDATRKKSRAPIPLIKIDADRIRRIDSRILNIRFLEGALLVIQVEGDGRAVLEKMISLPELGRVPIVAAVSRDVPLHEPTLLVWGLFTRFDCARDTFFSRIEIEKGHPKYDGTLFIDATWKHGYPEPLTMDERIIELVSKRWTDYGFTDTPETEEDRLYQLQVNSPVTLKIV